MDTALAENDLVVEWLATLEEETLDAEDNLIKMSTALNNAYEEPSNL